MRSFSLKSHKYETKNDLKAMTPIQIVNIDPSDIGFHIDHSKGNLVAMQQKALNRLLAIKQAHKLKPNEQSRKKAILAFLDREGLLNDPDVDDLISEMQSVVMAKEIQSDRATMRQTIDDKDFSNRLLALNDKTPVPYTSEEQLFLRMEKLSSTARGIKSKKTKSKKTKSKKTKSMKTKSMKTKSMKTKSMKSKSMKTKSMKTK